MPKPDQTELSWFRKAAEKVVREQKNFLLVLDELGIDGFRPAEADEVYRSKAFQTVLRQERLRYANELASDPQLSKNTAIGMMLLAIQKLFDEGEWDKALEGVQKLSKLTGWQGSENVTVFADLRGKDIEDLKRQIESRTSKGTSQKSLN